MKIRHFTPLFLSSFSIAGLLTSACAKDATTQTQAAASVQAEPAPASGQPAPTQVAPMSVRVPAPSAPAVAAAPIIVVNPDAAASWTSIKDLTFEQRPAFIAGMNRLEGIVDTEISGLNSKRAGMTTDTKDWDFAMKGLVDDQTYLKAMNDEVSKVESENWIQEKERVEAAWQNTQDAYAKVLHSTTAP
jgi:hypothetical protein